MVPWTGFILIFFASLLRRDPKKRWQDALTAIGYAVYVGLGIQVHFVIASHTPRTIDPLLLQIDRSLGFDPIAFANAISHHGLLMIVLIVSYVILPLAIGMAWVIEQDETLRRAILLGGIFCFVSYALFPAVGPAFYNWASASPTFAPRNCMPSMHFSWALLIAVNARAKWLKVCLGFYACLIAVATIALGEHYLIDLVVALLYVVVIQFSAVKLNFDMPVSHKMRIAALQRYPRALMSAKDALVPENVKGN